MTSTPPVTEVPSFIDLVTPPTVLAVIPRVREATPVASPTTPRVQRLSSLQKDRDQVAFKIFETNRKIEKEIKRNDPARKGYLDSLEALKLQWEQRFDVLSDEIKSHPTVNYRTDFPQIRNRKQRQSAVDKAIQSASTALNNSGTADAVITTLLTPAENLPSDSSTADSDDTSVDNESEEEDEANEDDNIDSYFEDDDPNFLLSGFHGYTDSEHNSTSDSDSDSGSSVTYTMTPQDWADFSRTQAAAIRNGFSSISALNFKKEIPEFTGDLDESLPVDEWFKIADKVATAAQWTDAQRLVYYKDRMTKSAANFSAALPALTAGDNDNWRAAMINGFQDLTLRNLRKDQLKHLKQRQAERTRDFKKRIDETYRNAYGAAIDDSQEADVLTLKNEVKKEALLNGLRSEILFLIWGRLPPNATYDETANTAVQCKQIIDVRRTTESRTLGQILETEKKAQKTEIDDIKSLIQQMANLQVSSLNAAGTAKTVAYIQDDSDRQREVRFADRPRGRNDSPGPRPFRRPSFNQRFDSRRQRSVSPRWENSNGELPQERDTRTCYYCKNRGHIKRECRKYRAFLENQRNNPNRRNRGQSPAPNFRRN